MKKLILLTILLNFNTTHSSAQITYFNYLDYTSQWNFQIFTSNYNFPCGANDSTYSMFTQFINGDTLIGNNWYYKLYTTRKDSFMCSGYTNVTSSTLFETGIREDSQNRIYENTGGGEVLIWNFNISIGDTVNTFCPIINIDTTWLGTRPLKRFHCDCPVNNKIIEGVGGGSMGLLNTAFCSFLVHADVKFICYSKQNDLIQLDSTVQCGLTPHTALEKIKPPKLNYIKAYPNPASSNLTISIAPYILKNNTHLKIISTLGKLMLSKTIDSPILNININSYPKGVYYIDITSSQGKYTYQFIKK